MAWQSARARADPYRTYSCTSDLLCGACENVCGSAQTTIILIRQVVCRTERALINIIVQLIAAIAHVDLYRNMNAEDSYL